MQVVLEEALRERERETRRETEKTAEEQKRTKNNKPTIETTGNRPNVQSRQKVSTSRQIHIH